MLRIAAPPNKGMKLTKPGELRSFAAYSRCSTHLARRGATATAEQARDACERPQAETGDRVAAANVCSAKPYLPVVGDILTLAMLRALPRMNVVTKLVVQHSAEQYRPDQRQPRHPARKPFDDLVDEQLDPCRLATALMMVEPTYFRVSSLPAPGPAPATAAPPSQGGCVGQNDSPQTTQVLLRDGEEQIFHRRASVRTGVRSPCRLRLPPPSRMRVSRGVEGASNNQLKLTAPFGTVHGNLVRRLVLADARTGAAAYARCSTDT